MATETTSRRVLFEVEILDPAEQRPCFVCNAAVWPMHAVRPKDGDFGRYACFAHVSEVMVGWDDDRETQDGE